MVDLLWAEFWWNNITGANMVVAVVTEALKDNKMVVLDVPSDLPWRYQMRSAIEHNFRKNASSENILVQTIDVSDDCGDTEPGRYLLKRFCKSGDVEKGYRDGSKYSIQQYLINNNVLHDSIIWVKGLEKKQAKEWVRFCRDYDSSSVSDGLFLLEVHDFNDTIDSRRTSIIRFNNLVSSYDVQLFNSFILDSKHRFSANWKKYISTVAATLCESDAEISAELLDAIDFTSIDPIAGLKAIDDSNLFPSRGGEPDSKHVLAYYRKGNMKELEKRIWTAQVQTLFPLIELERAKIINIYAEEIQEAINSEDIKQYGEIISKPDEVEIGTLDFMVKKYKINMPLAIDRERIEFLHNYRNEIAHMGCLTAEEVTVLLSQHF